MAKQTAYRGCLLGLAIGDAMGYTVDDRSIDRIRQDYGPEGLLGYDLVNGYADISSHTQLAAFVGNGLLLGLTRGQLRGVMAPYVRYIALAEREWAQQQRYSAGPERITCWIGRHREFRGRRCMDTRMLDTLHRGQSGTPEEPVNRHATPGALTAAIPVGLFFNPLRTDREEICRLGAEAVALTHGAPQAFLSGSALAHMISRILWDSAQDLPDLVQETASLLRERFGREFAQADEVADLLDKAAALAASHSISCSDAMEQLVCETAPQVLAGGVYTALCHSRNFDEAMITAVNHSGRSAAVGAVTGALLGALLGEEGLPEFYMEPMEAAPVLQELADDLYNGCPMERGGRLFDDDWDRKYVHGGQD